MVVLGTGDWQYEAAFREAQVQYPGRFAAQITYSAPLSTAIYAGADLFLMPSGQRALRPEPDDRHALRHCPRSAGDRRPEGHRHPLQQVRAATGRGFYLLPTSTRRIWSGVLREAVDLYLSNKKAWRGTPEGGHDRRLQLEQLRPPISGDLSAYPGLVDSGPVWVSRRKRAEMAAVLALPPIDAPTPVLLQWSLYGKIFSPYRLRDFYFHFKLTGRQIMAEYNKAQLTEMIVGKLLRNFGRDSG